VAGHEPGREDGGITFEQGVSTTVFPIVLLVIAIVPIVLIALVADTVRTARRVGGLPPFTTTYRAYSA
jgi:Na+/H+-dicarboxylate symporter